jgi:hypothetical protein
MTTAFLNRCADEVWAVADSRDRFVKDSPVNTELLDVYLKEVGKWKP